LKLFNGDISIYGNDHSKAAHGLLKDVAKYTGDFRAINEIFVKSKLHRDHWIEKWERLRNSEILKAIDAAKADGTLKMYKKKCIVYKSEDADVKFE